nr:MAG TPA: hypothetical protein [Bacteriophage sp.]DAT56876.1 MAG TPA: hypothetical protein [Bacteriophage sp.]DAW42473.1 MAG TPA: hypothetical protein [Bacteriophage sp.]
MTTIVLTLFTFFSVKVFWLFSKLLSARKL